MKKIIICCICAVSSLFLLAQDRIENLQSDYFLMDFAEPNEFGDTIYYLYWDNAYEVVIGEMVNAVTPFITDSLVIPKSVKHLGVECTVVGMLSTAFRYTPDHVLNHFT